MENTNSRDIVDQYLSSAFDQFKKEAAKLVSVHGDDLTVLQVRNLRNSIFTNYVREFAIQERDTFSSGVYSSALADFVERFVDNIDTAVINDFPILECPMIVADF